MEDGGDEAKQRGRMRKVSGGGRKRVCGGGRKRVCERTEEVDQAKKELEEYLNLLAGLTGKLKSIGLKGLMKEVSREYEGLHNNWWQNSVSN